ncbi:hypothetical protein NDU88_008505 [Pleurodeles waltl]|uniref:Uncharacterized protein n=1 Tax=Pleurodeles waltl TaxID=8319 RepID=A0AAV7P136_PLEWA|nr:hypothetical protein NDU88_008505 [Pleurodeles waltl]
MPAMALVASVPKRHGWTSAGHRCQDGGGYAPEQRRILSITYKQGRGLQNVRQMGPSLWPLAGTGVRLRTICRQKDVERPASGGRGRDRLAASSRLEGAWLPDHVGIIHRIADGTGSISAAAG